MADTRGWVTGLGLCFINSGGTWGSAICVEWLGRLGHGLGGWGGVLSVCVVSLNSVDGRSRYLYFVLGGYMHILGAPSVQSCCTLSIL